MHDSQITELTNLDKSVHSPAHYQGKQGLEVETVLENFLPFYVDSYEAHRAASALEYILRSPRKNDLEDIKKARYNLDQLIKYREARYGATTDN